MGLRGYGPWGGPPGRWDQAGSRAEGVGSFPERKGWAPGPVCGE